MQKDLEGYYIRVPGNIAVVISFTLSQPDPPKTSEFKQQGAEHTSVCQRAKRRASHELQSKEHGSCSDESFLRAATCEKTISSVVLLRKASLSELPVAIPLAFFTFAAWRPSATVSAEGTSSDNRLDNGSPKTLATLAICGSLVSLAAGKWNPHAASEPT